VRSAVGMSRPQPTRAPSRRCAVHHHSSALPSSWMLAWTTPFSGAPAKLRSRKAVSCRATSQPTSHSTLMP